MDRRIMMLVETKVKGRGPTLWETQTFQILMWKVSLQPPVQTVEEMGAAKQVYNYFVGKLAQNLNSTFSPQLFHHLSVHLDT